MIPNQQWQSEAAALRSCQLFFTTAFGTSRSARPICFIPSKDGYPGRMWQFVTAQAVWDRGWINCDCTGDLEESTWNPRTHQNLRRGRGRGHDLDTTWDPHGMAWIPWCPWCPGQRRNLQHFVRFLAEVEWRLGNLEDDVLIYIVLYAQARGVLWVAAAGDYNMLTSNGTICSQMCCPFGLWCCNQISFHQSQGGHLYGEANAGAPSSHTLWGFPWPLGGNKTLMTLGDRIRFYKGSYRFI